jgi:hypothetical protein
VYVHSSADRRLTTTDIERSRRGLAMPSNLPPDEVRWLLDEAKRLVRDQDRGWALARAHARSGDRIAIASYLGSRDAFDPALTGFSETYADQNERDHAALLRAEKDGRIGVSRGL